MSIRSFVILPLLLTTLVAQQRGGLPELGRKPKPGVRVNDSGEPIRDTGDSRPGKANAVSQPRRGASSFCQFYVHSKPARLMPGQQGTLIITAVLKGKAVLPAPAPIAVKSPPQQGFFTLGSAVFQPARPGRLAQAYLGRPVYDNWVIMEMPVTVGGEAPMGSKQTIAVELEFELFDGGSAQSIGKFGDRAVGSIEIGEAPDPEVRGGFVPVAVVSQPGLSSPGEVAVEPVPVADSTPAIGGSDAVAVPAEPVQQPDGNERIDESAPLVADEDQLPWALIGGGGALLVLVLLLAKKRR